MERQRRGRVRRLATVTAPSEETDTSVSGLWGWVMLVLTITALAEVAGASGYLGTPREAV